MYITHAGTRYQVKAVQTTVCPAGSAYWLIQVHEVLHSRLNNRVLGSGYRCADVEGHDVT